MTATGRAAFPLVRVGRRLRLSWWCCRCLRKKVLLRGPGKKVFFFGLRDKRCGCCSGGRFGTPFAARPTGSCCSSSGRSRGSRGGRSTAAAVVTKGIKIKGRRRFLNAGKARLKTGRLWFRLVAVLLAQRESNLTRVFATGLHGRRRSSIGTVFHKGKGPSFVVVGGCVTLFVVASTSAATTFVSRSTVAQSVRRIAGKERSHLDGVGL